MSKLSELMVENRQLKERGADLEKALRRLMRMIEHDPSPIVIRSCMEQAHAALEKK